MHWPSEILVESRCDRHSINLSYIAGFLTTVSVRSCHIRSIERVCSAPRWGYVNQTRVKLVGRAGERWDPGVQSAFFKGVRWCDFFCTLRERFVCLISWVCVNNSRILQAGTVILVLFQSLAWNFSTEVTNVSGRMAVPLSAVTDTPVALEKVLQIALYCIIQPCGS